VGTEKTDPADAPVMIAGTSLPYFFHPTEVGAYNILFDQIAAGLDTDENAPPYQLNFLPVRRAYREFLSKTNDCFFIANRRNYLSAETPQFDENIITSDTIHVSLKKIYTLKTAPTLESMESLENLMFAADQGAGTQYILPKLLPKTSELVATEGIGQSIQLLQSGRVDAIVAYELDMVAYLQMQASEPIIHASDSFNIQESESAIACWGKPNTVRFLNAVNTRIANLKASGEMIDPVKLTGTKNP
jgi:ABC-type amino acid transport substrate-binding protein